MAIKAIIATQFDATGIKKASKEFAALGGTLRSALGTVGVGLSLATLVNTLRDASKAAVEDTKSQALLAQQLRNTTGATDSQIAAVEQSISAMQLSASVADDVLRPAFSQLIRATGDFGTATRLTQIALDVSAATGRDLGAVSIALSRAYSGNTTALSRLGIKAKDGVNIFDQLETQFSGAAEAAALNDPYQRLTIIFGEIQEKIGIALLPELSKLADFFASPEGQKELAGYANLMKELAGVFIFLGTTIAEFLAGFRVVGAAFGKLFAGDFKGFIDLMNSRGMVEALSKLDSVGTTAEDSAKKINGLDFGDGSGLGGGGGSGSGSGKNALAEAAKKAAQIAQKAADEAQEMIDKQNELIDDFKSNILELSEAFRGLGESSKELGQFEEQASSAFNALNEEIKKGLNDRAITQAAAKFLYDYVAVEKAALTALARQRDVLLSRIAIATDISRGVVNAVNITGLLTNETRQVTKSVKTLVNGIATTISSTYDEVITGNLADSFKKLVDRTKNFAKNLITLKKLGLNGTLFKQIVDAGSEAGGATAEAIIAGGADTVTELNGLFDELNKAGSDIAAESTDVFYDLGEGVSNAFIDGLKSQEAILAAQIASMVASIEAAFASMMARLNQLGAAPMTNANGFAYETALPGVSGSAMQFGSATPWAQAVASFRESQTPTVNNYITVKAGAIVAEKSAGQLITSLQNKYTKASG
jgi:hypothetical protein